MFEYSENDDQTAAKVFMQSRILRAKAGSGCSAVITDEYSAAGALVYVKRAMQMIFRSAGDLFEVKTGRGSGIPYLHATSLGTQLISCVTDKIPLILRLLPRHYYLPEAVLVDRIFKDYSLSNVQRLIGEEAVATAKLLNGAVTRMRNESKTKEFLRKVEYFQDLAKEDYDEVRSLMEKCFERCEKVLIVRLTLIYSTEDRNNTRYWSDLMWKSVYKCVTRDQELLKESLASVYGQYCLGFICKAIYGGHDGLRLHAVIMLDGSKFSDEMDFIELLWNSWRAQDFDEEDLCGDIDVLSNASLYCGSELKLSSDNDLKEALNLLAAELTASDKFVKLILYNDMSPLFISSMNIGYKLSVVRMEEALFVPEMVA